MTDTKTKESAASDPVAATAAAPVRRSPPFKIAGPLSRDVQTKIATLNFNNAMFQHRAGYDDKDFERRVALLAKLVRKWAQEGVSVINLQEISGRFMKLSTLQHKLMDGLSDSWRCTGPVSRHGDPSMCLCLMTLWNEDVFHLDKMINFHYSQHYDGRAGDQLAADCGIFATSNALCCFFSVVDCDSVPVPNVSDPSPNPNPNTNTNTDPDSSASSLPLHTGGKTIDVRNRIAIINTHLPLRGPLKLRCLKRLKSFVSSQCDQEEIGYVICGDMNVFADEAESGEMVRLLKRMGDVSAPKGLLTTVSGGTRATSFVPTKYDAEHNMQLLKPDTDPAAFAIWMAGNPDTIRQVFQREVSPLDWVVVSDTWFLTWKETVVYEPDDLAKIDPVAFRTWKQSFDTQGLVPDYGNFLSDHLPLVTTVMIRKRLPPTVARIEPEVIKGFTY